MQPTKKPSTQTTNNFVLERWRQSSVFSSGVLQPDVLHNGRRFIHSSINWGSCGKGVKRNHTHLPFCWSFSFPCCTQHLLQKACMIKVSKHCRSDQSCKSFELPASQQQSSAISIEILQHDPVDPDLSNSDVRSWLKEEEPQVLKLVKKISCNPQTPQILKPHWACDLKKNQRIVFSNDDDAQDAVVNHHHLSASIWFVLQNPLYPDRD